MLKNDFVCGYRDIENEKWAGASGNHRPDGQAVDTTNGAGAHNVQIFVLAADGTVLTCLPGYWSPEDLASELKLAQALNGVWQNPRLSDARKFELFQQMQIAHIAEHSEDEHQRSQMQGFDASFEAGRRFKNQDVFAKCSSHKSLLTWSNASKNIKTTDLIMHERMARQPFVPYENFNVQVFCDYGLSMYDKHEDALAVNGHYHRGRRRGSIGNYHPVADTLSSLARL